MIAIVRGALEEKEFDKVFQAEKMDIPRAPALGLLLENVSSIYQLWVHTMLQ